MYTNVYVYVQPTQDKDDLISDEELARQLQMEEDAEVSRWRLLPLFKIYLDKKKGYESHKLSYTFGLS